MRNNLRKNVAILCLALSALVIGVHEATRVYSESIENLGPTVRDKCRYLILLLCILGFFFSSRKRRIWMTAGIYALSLLLAGFWIWSIIDHFVTNELFFLTKDKPFLLWIATPLEWSLFAALITAFIVHTYALFLPSHNPADI